MEKRFTFLGENHSHDHAINTKNTSHNHGNDGFHYKFRFQDSHTADPDTTFSCTIGSSEVWNLRMGFLVRSWKFTCENQGTSHSEVAEKETIAVLARFGICRGGFREVV